jgi:hypothetical protein
LKAKRSSNTPGQRASRWLGDVVSVKPLRLERLAVDVRRALERQRAEHVATMSRDLVSV